MLSHFGRLTRLFKSFPSLAKKYCESGCFSTLHYQSETSMRVQLLCNVTSARTTVDWWQLHLERLELNKHSPDAPPYQLNEKQKFLLTNDDPQVAYELEKILMYLFVSKQKGDYLPDILTLRDLKVMLDMRYMKRVQYVKSLVLRELQDQISKHRKAIIVKQLDEWRQERSRHKDAEIPWLNYHLFGNALFQRILKRTANLSDRHHVATAMQFEQTIVLDCSFDHLMRHQDAKDCAKQIIMTLTSNKNLRRPYNITFCDFHDNEKMPSNLHFLNPSLLALPITVTEQNLTEFYPREKLVYLTPDSSEDLVYNPDDIYVIGAFVDKVDKEPYSAGKARRLGIRTARLPLDRYCDWLMGSKSLCLNQVFDILATVRDHHGDWSRAFSLHIPARKIKAVYAQKPREVKYEGRSKRWQRQDSSDQCFTNRQYKENFDTFKKGNWFEEGTLVHNNNKRKSFNSTTRTSSKTWKN